MGDNAPVRVAIAGLGTIAEHHADSVVELGHNLVAGIDIDQEAREGFAGAYDARTYATFDEMASDADVDALVVTTPNRFHEEYAVAGLDAGLDVLVEKPLAHAVASAERIAAAADRAEGFCMVGFNYRFAPGASIIDAYRREGRFGDVRHIEANYVRQRGVPSRGSWITNRNLAGGGALVDIGVHAVDLALYFLGFPEPTEVLGSVRSEFGCRDDYTYVDTWRSETGTGGFDVEDSATAFVQFANGATLSLDVAWAANRPPNDELVIRGTEAGATFDRRTGDLTVHGADQTGVPHLRETRVETRDVETHRRQDEVFLDAVAAGAAPSTNTVDEALVVQRVLDAVYRSATEGRAVQLTGDLAGAGGAPDAGAGSQSL